MEYYNWYRNWNINGKCPTLAHNKNGDIQTNATNWIARTINCISFGIFVAWKFQKLITINKIVYKVEFDVAFHANRATNFTIFVCVSADLMCGTFGLSSGTTIPFPPFTVRAANNLFIVCAHDLWFCLFCVIYSSTVFFFALSLFARIRLILFVLARFFLRTSTNKQTNRIPFVMVVFYFCCLEQNKTKKKRDRESEKIRKFILINQNDS